MLDEEIRSKAAEFCQAARDHANTFDRPQRYSAICYRDKAGNALLRRYDFLLQPAAATIAMMGESEPANGPGVLSIALRYNEALSRSTFQKDAELFRLLHEEIGAVRSENEKLRRENAEMRAEAFRHMQATQDMILARHRLELEHEKNALDPLRADAARTNEVWRAGMHVVGKMVENVTGLPLLGGGDGGGGPVASFLQSIPPEKIARMLEHLSDDEKARFGQAVASSAGKANGVA
jgi:hypothetical protein